MDPTTKRFLLITVVVLVLLWLLFSVLGMTNLGSVRID